MLYEDRTVDVAVDPRGWVAAGSSGSLLLPSITTESGTVYC